MPRQPILPFLLAAILLAACHETATQLPGVDEDDPGGPPPWAPVPLVVTANAVGGTPGIDTAYARVPLRALLKVENGNGPEVGPLDVSLFYEFSEISDSVALAAVGVYRLGEEELTKVSAFGSTTVTVASNDSALVEVGLGTPRHLTEMSASRHFILTDVAITGIRLHDPDTLDAARQIRIETTERIETRKRDFGSLGTVFAGVIAPALVPGAVSLVGATLTGTSTLEGTADTVWEFEKAPMSRARIVFDVVNRTPATIAAGVPWAISHDADQPLVVVGDTIWPQVVVMSGTTASAIEAGATLSIDTGVESTFSEHPVNEPEYAILIDTRNVARGYPIWGTEEAIRAYINVRDAGGG